MHPSLTRLFDRHAATVHAGRSRFARLADGQRWEYDGRDGVLHVGALALPAGLLAIESLADGTWTWGWADVGRGAALGALRESLALRDFGQARGLADLTATGPFQPPESAEWLAVLGAGIVGASAVFRGATDAGVLTVVLRDHPALQVEREDSPVRLGADFLRAIAQLPIVDHRRALDGLARDRSFAPRHRDDTITVGGLDDLRLTAQFAEGRLIELRLDRSEPADRPESTGPPVLRLRG